SVPAALYRPRAAVTVPIVTARACARCHDLSSPRDAAASCLVAGQDGLGRARPTVCFDEHRPAGREAGAAAARSAAWEAARAVASLAPLAPATAAAGRLQPWLWIGLAAIAALLAWSGTRVRDRMRRSRNRPAVAATPPAAARLPVINAATCLGCYACVDACPFDVLEVRRYVATVARPADCCGLTLCEQRCPNASLVMSAAPAPDRAATPAATPIATAITAPTTAPALGESLESREVPGLFLAGDVTGMALIRNAINQGAQAVRTIAAAGRARDRPDHVLDLVIVGAGPAGLSAALEAQALRLRYLVLEQASVADSIRSFPRGKLVLDPDLPLIGRLWLAETTKEELLSRWLHAVRRERPAIREGQRVTSIERTADGFAVASVSADGRPSIDRAARVLLAVGRRGTPRRLPIDVPPAWSDRVHYSLADARSFAGQRVLVVGMGDVAMEAALALSRQPGTEVAVSYRGDDFRRGKARNIAEVRRRAAAGALRLLWRTELRRLEPGRALLASPDGTAALPCDAVLAFIGSIPPESLLRAAGMESGEIPPESRPLNPVEPASCRDGPEEARS
ncbi:MAG TPA: NAD(P)-binding domain-containing protein, partial [Kofleriaceae bacterium]|nr:NAD(P)-binding domain-containing protein [Kofleriaceae bacterium]